MSRLRINLNREWKFFRGDVTGAEHVDFDDSAWQSVGLPHTFDLPYFRTPEFYVGAGWYRKIIRDSGLWPVPRRAFLEFDGAFQVAEVFVNGNRVGEHKAATPASVLTSLSIFATATISWPSASTTTGAHAFNPAPASTSSVAACIAMCIC